MKKEDIMGGVSAKHDDHMCALKEQGGNDGLCGGY